ncbi:LOW QUALITY PROTEIN: hypothetical protein PoB_006015100 [Plakobranchus ocellatus]|uniref:Uncharacterized protein n=1 Tax=Plakobranchus ocellatus TaxID=259542 RepID=A0AAV4CP52_9GAST|nr:LOW QUALITY PROTEIN: hypothetical protein PoB_006015100 [Plakobranchus ocellatus]
MLATQLSTCTLTDTRQLGTLVTGSGNAISALYYSNNATGITASLQQRNPHHCNSAIRITATTQSASLQQRNPHHCNNAIRILATTQPASLQQRNRHHCNNAIRITATTQFAINT